MKLSIKKKYIVGLAMLVSGVSGYLIFQELVKVLINRSLDVLILPAVFIFSTIYAIVYWVEFRQNEKIATDVSKEEAQGDEKKQGEIKGHLVKKIFDDAYTLNFMNGKIKLTNSWGKQKEYESKYR
jgi:hypothetical protein